jgi:hypothetical protein
MGSWTVELIGSEHDLDRIASLSQPPTWIVRRQDDRYVLQAEDFGWYSDPEEVRDYARDQLLPIINGIARLAFGPMMSCRIGIGPGTDFKGEQGQRTGSRFVEQSAVISATEVATVTVINGPGPANRTPPPPSMAEIATALRYDSRVQDALHFFAYDDDWAVNLYKVYEIVRANVGGKDKDLINRHWVTADEVDNFRSVHDPSVIGRQARHGVHTRQSPSDPMGEDEARMFIQRLLDEWLMEKHRQLGANMSKL